MASSSNDTVTVLYFNYEDTKKAFHIMQSNYIEKNKLTTQISKLWTRQKVVSLIMKIGITGHKPNTLEETNDYYDVIDLEGEYKLVLRSVEDSSKYRRIVPYEECFDIVVHLHRLFGHRDICKSSYDYISKTYVLDAIWLYFIARACNLCDSCRRTEVSEIHKGLGEFKQCYRIFTILMNNNSVASPYTYLLLIVDKFTSFVYLRPLTMCDEDNIAIELFKVFTDYGIPKSLETLSVEFCTRVCNIIGNFIPQHKVTVNAMPIHYSNWPARVTAYLQDWMEINDSENWVIGSQSVQWHMNHIVRDKKTPFLNVFKMEPFRDLYIE